jgi:hypothetical protein
MRDAWRIKMKDKSIDDLDVPRSVAGLVALCGDRGRQHPVENVAQREQALKRQPRWVVDGQARCRRLRHPRWNPTGARADPTNYEGRFSTVGLAANHIENLASSRMKGIMDAHLFLRKLRVMLPTPNFARTTACSTSTAPAGASSP